MRDTLTLDEVALSGCQRFFCHVNQLVAFRIYRVDHVKSTKSESHMRHAKPLPCGYRAWQEVFQTAGFCLHLARILNWSQKIG